MQLRELLNLNTLKLIFTSYIFYLQAEWHPNRDDIFFVGSMNQPRQIDVYSDQGDHFPMSDKGEYLASVCSIVKCHPSQDIVVGGNSSGRVHVFKE